MILILTIQTGQQGMYLLRTTGKNIIKPFTMKKLILLFTILVQASLLFSNPVIDSLRAVINHDTTTAETRLWTYKALTDQLMKEDLDSCRVVCQEAIDYAAKEKKFKHESVFNIVMGTTYYYQGDYNVTARYWLNALSISEAAQDTPRIDQLFNNLGILYRTTGEYEMSREYFKKSLDLKIKAGDPNKIAIAEMNYGYLLHMLKEHDSAYSYLSNALPVFQAGNDKKALSIIYNNLGSIHLAKQEYQEAIKNYYIAYDLIEYLPTYERAVLLLNMANCLIVFLDKPGEGMVYIEKSLEMAKANSNLRVIRNVYEIYSNYYSKIGDYKNAFKYLELNSLYKDSLFTVEKEKEIKELQATFDFERKEAALNQQMEIAELKNFRQQRANRIMIAILFAGLSALVIISYLFAKVKKAKRKVELTQNELEKTNSDLSKAKAEIERVLEFKSQFLANMSHEVRTPLNVIIGFNSNLKRKIQDSKLLEFVDAIEVSSYNLLALLNDILDMSKIEAGRMKINPVNTNLRSLVTEIWYSFSLRAKDKNLEVNFRYADNLPDNFYLDHTMVRQILVNLVGNAVKFTYEGFVNINVQQGKPDPRVYATSLYDIDIIVEDSGIGIRNEDKQHIFDAFYQAPQKSGSVYGGTGLGLAISQELAKLMGGEILLESQQGKGSKFTLVLRKLSAGVPEVSEYKSQRIALPDMNFSFTGGVLLVADDEELNRKMVSSFFEDTAVQLHIVENGEELIKKAREVKPTVILSDMKMPVLNGIEAAIKLKSIDELKDIPIIAFTASIDFSKLDPEIRKMFSGCINKPVDITELFERLSFFLPVSKKIAADTDISA